MRSDDPGFRADACHYLGLSDSPEVIPELEVLFKDTDRHVREIAEETLAELKS